MLKIAPAVITIQITAAEKSTHATHAAQAPSDGTEFPMKSLSCVGENPPLFAGSCWNRRPYEGDYFGQNMKTVHWEMLTTSLKYNSC